MSGRADGVARLPIPVPPSARVRRKIPTFNRPAVTVTAARARRGWVTLQAKDLRVGDIVASFGLLTAVEVDTAADVVRLVGGENVAVTWATDASVFVFAVLS